jgi:hypothetical protein
MSQPPDQSPSGQPWNQPGSGQPFGEGPTQPWGQSPQQPSQDPQQPSWGAQQQPEQPQWGAPQNPYQGQPNPDVPSSVPPGYPPTTAYPAGDPGFSSTPGYPDAGSPSAPGYPGSGTPGSGAPGYPASGAPAAPGYPTSGAPNAPGYGAQNAPGYGASSDPGYGASGAPGYPAPGGPGYGAPGGPGFPAAPGGPGLPPGQPPKKKSKAVPIILVSLAIVLLLCVGGGVAIYLTGKNVVDEAVKQVDSAASSQPSAGGKPSTTKTAGTITVVEPKTLGGRSKITDPSLSAAAAELKSDLAGVPDAKKTVGSIYGNVSKQDIVIVAAAAAEVADPAKELDATFKTAGSGGLELSGITSAPTGSLGGSAKCGKGEASGAPLIMCGWADSGSVGWIIWYFESMDKAKAEFPKLRAQVEKKS